MKIEVWSDIACPFCYIGKRNLEAALARFEHRDQVEVTLRSFELDPKAPKDPGISVHEMLAGKYGMSVEEARRMNQALTLRAAGAGLAFNMDKVILTNLFDAHRLLQLAKKHGLQAQVAERLFGAYFTEGMNLGSHEMLEKIAVQAGLDAQEAREALRSGAFADEVRREEEAALELGLSGVPAYIIAGKYLISGAQPEAAMLEALEKAWAAGRSA
jgi:predicted DsbA family dithiol-disulfide isomerase